MIQTAGSALLRAAMPAGLQGAAALALPALLHHLAPGPSSCSPSGAAASPSHRISTASQCAAAFGHQGFSSRDASSGGKRGNGAQWRLMQQQGHVINPCNSPLHPAALEAGITGPDPQQPEVSVQEAYTPTSMCFGCGPAHPDGLHLRSKRIQGGLEARVSLPAKYCAFPGIINGGVVSTLLDCHGNWTAAVALMDKACLPKPPLTLTASMLVSFREPTPPDSELIVRSSVVKVVDQDSPGHGRVSVEVDLSVLLARPEGGEKLLVTATGIFKRLGALRAM